MAKDTIAIAAMAAANRRSMRQEGRPLPSVKDIQREQARNSPDAAVRRRQEEEDLVPGSEPNPEGGETLPMGGSNDDVKDNVAFDKDVLVDDGAGTQDPTAPGGTHEQRIRRLEATVAKLIGIVEGRYSPQGRKGVNESAVRVLEQEVLPIFAPKTEAVRRIVESWKRGAINTESMINKIGDESTKLDAVRFTKVDDLLRSLS